MNRRIYWAGDSTVAQNYITSFPQTGIGQVMHLYLQEDVEIHNFAMNGRSSKSFIGEGRLEAIKKEIKKGDYFFIQFGHNDQKEEEARYTEPFTTYQEHLKQYIDAAKENEAVPVLITSLYRRIFSRDGRIMDHIHFDYPDAMIKLGMSLKVPVIDLCAKSKALLENTGDEASKKWFMHIAPGIYKKYRDGLSDNTHLQYEGAVKMAGLIADGLEELGGKFKNLVGEGRDIFVS